MMQDRPVVAFPWDVVPGRFWGRGICEKGYNAQKALDTELRARIDALAFTVHPMMAVDASRLPRGAKLEIRPGKLFLLTVILLRSYNHLTLVSLDPTHLTKRLPYSKWFRWLQVLLMPQVFQDLSMVMHCGRYFNVSWCNHQASQAYID
jgi:hypothetical protein